MSLGPAHRGYQYQDLLTAYHFAFSLTNDIESITVDKKFHDLDLFDDLTFQTNGRTLRRQIKSSQDENTYFEKKHLTTTFRDLEIDSLIKSVKEEGAAIANEYRLWATWKEPIDDLKDYLIPSTAAPTFPGIQTKLFRLRPDLIWNEGHEPVWDRLKNSIEFTRQDFVNFAERFVIELEFPSFSTDLFLPGTLETLLLNLLINSVGIGRYPNHRQNPVDIAARLVQLANSARTQSKIVSREEIETTIQLQKDFGRVAQQFPIEKSIEVEGLDIQNTIEKNIGSQTV